MNFETISKYKFEPMEKSARYVQEIMRVTGNHVTITQSLYERMNEPEYLSFGYDAEHNAIGILVSDEKDLNSTPCKREKTGTVRLNNSAFIANRLYEILKADPEKKSIILQRGCKVNDYYVFELRYAEVQNKIGRKKND